MKKGDQPGAFVRTNKKGQIKKHDHLAIYMGSFWLEVVEAEMEQQHQIDASLYYKTGNSKGWGKQHMKDQ